MPERGWESVEIINKMISYYEVGKKGRKAWKRKTV